MPAAPTRPAPSHPTTSSSSAPAVTRKSRRPNLSIASIPPPRRESPRSSRHCSSGCSLAVEPQIFETPAVVDAVDHDRQALDVRLPAARRLIVKDDWPGAILLQFAVDRPHQFFPLLGVGLHRLPRELFFELGIAIPGDVPLRSAGIVLEQLLIRVVDRASCHIQSDRIFLA